MTDENQAGGTATADPKTKRKRAPQTFRLVEVVRDEQGEIGAYNRLPQPTVKSDSPRREDILRAVKKALADGNEAAIKYYANKELTVVAHPEPVTYKCEVEVVEVRKVKITEG